MFKIHCTFFYILLNDLLRSRLLGGKMGEFFIYIQEIILQTDLKKMDAVISGIKM